MLEESGEKKAIPSRLTVSYMLCVYDSELICTGWDIQVRERVQREHKKGNNGGKVAPRGNIGCVDFIDSNETSLLLVLVVLKGLKKL